jgi:pimeloyl-ACP methyl ester carboxylesterase
VTAGKPKHRRIELRIPVNALERPAETWEIAATIHLPDPDRLASPPAILVCLPGGGYNRRYFDLGITGYSQAEYHVGRGTIMVAFDYVGAGDSTIPPLTETAMAAVAATTDKAVKAICVRLIDGTLQPGFPPVGPAAIVGIGQSMGGFAIVATQAAHRTFDAIAVMGASMVETQLPQPLGKAAVIIPPGTSVAEAAAMVLAGSDWRYAFYWEDVDAAIVTADADGGLPIRITAPDWGSMTIPGMGTALVLPGIIAAEAAAVDVPVLVAMGERDVCCAPMREFAAFSSARDLALLVVPRMAHMHNFAGTRALLWARLDAFIGQVAQALSASA